MQGSPRGCHQDLHNIFSQGSRQDLGQDLHVLCAMKPLQERHRRTFQRTQKISYQNPREPVKSSTAPQRERSDTHKVTRRLRVSALCRGLRACAIEMHTWTSQKRPFMREFTVKMPQANTGTTLRRSFCASLRSRNADGRQNLQEECRLS